MTLTYRGKAIARLVPIRATKDQIRADDPFYTLSTHADTGSPDNSALTNREIDRALYGQD